jgi:hypothetical protein
LIPSGARTIALRSSSRTGKLKFQDGQVMMITEGKGHTMLDGVKHSWEKGDVVNLPLRKMIKRMRDRHEWPEERKNPFEGKSLQKPKNSEATGWLPATDAEIGLLLKGAPLAKKRANSFKDALGWFIALGIYTGMRQEEIAAIKKGDVLKQHGIWFIVIPKAKTPAGVRAVPLHPELMRAGFLKYVDSCKDSVFGVDGETIAKRFPEYRRAPKVKVTRDRVVFHSLRKSFTKRLERSDVPADTAGRLLGHKGMRSFTYDVYNPDGPELKQLKAAIDKVRYGRQVKLAGMN